MNSEVSVVHVDQEPPTEWSAAIYLCGPTPVDASRRSWRPSAVEELRRRWTSPGRLVVFVPEPSPQGRYPGYADQISWEETTMRHSDVVLFWVPRSMRELPGLVSNVKWGRWYDSGRVVLGAPPDAERMEYLLHFAAVNQVPVATTVDGACAAALTAVGAGASRRCGERSVPLLVWSTAPFQRWYRDRTAAGRRLLDAHVDWIDHRRGGWSLRVCLGTGDGRPEDGRHEVARVVHDPDRELHLP